MSNTTFYQGFEKDGKIFYQGKFRKIQSEKGWRYVFFEGKRVGVTTISTEPDLTTVEGWQQLYERNVLTPLTK